MKRVGRARPDETSGNLPQQRYKTGKLVVWLRLMDPRVGRAVMDCRTVLVNAGRLRMRDRKSGTQASNQREYDGDSQSHIPSIAMDMTRQRDARIHDFVVWPARFDCVTPATNSFQQPRKKAGNRAQFRTLNLRPHGERCIVYSKMTFAATHFSFTFRYWRSFWGTGAVGMAWAE